MQNNPVMANYEFLLLALFNSTYYKRALYLHVDVSTIVDEQLEAQHPAGGGSSQMQRRAAVVVGLINVGTAVHQFSGHRVLPRVTGHVERCVPKTIGLISLTGDRQERQSMNMKYNMLCNLKASSSTFNNTILYRIQYMKNCLPEQLQLFITSLPPLPVLTDIWPHQTVHWQQQHEVECNLVCPCTSHQHRETPAASQPPHVLKEMVNIYFNARPSRTTFILPLGSQSVAQLSPISTKQYNSVWYSTQLFGFPLSKLWMVSK